MIVPAEARSETQHYHPRARLLLKRPFLFLLFQTSQCLLFEFEETALRNTGANLVYSVYRNILIMN